MVNKRMLAVAAVVLLAVPTLGAAATISITTPTPEQLVEGHTVFTVIQTYTNTTNSSSQYAAAVAVLVRDATNTNSNVRFPGVLWFNDQYLVNPSSGATKANYRYPCGGAVMAVNRNDPDPRMTLVYANNQTISQNPQGNGNYDAILGVGYGANNSTVGFDGSSVYTDGTITALRGADYKESYFITDPNDHYWIIDRYNGYSRVGTSGLNNAIYKYPIWVVNMLGQPVFIPDDGEVSCLPYLDQIIAQSPVPLPPPVGGNHTAWEDNPKAGYNQPAGNSPTTGAAPNGGYCYDGNSHQPGTDCKDTTLYPTRLYNALLYFKLEDLTNAGTDVDHSDATSTDTNGCQDGTEWACPNGDDNKEGNSHPFNPTPHSGSNTAMACPAGFAQGTTSPDPTNHGGSGSTDTNTCSRIHATRNIDLYFSPTSRPLAPPNRTWGIPIDTQGSAAPFHGTGGP